MTIAYPIKDTAATVKDLAKAFFHDIMVSAGEMSNKRPIEVWGGGGPMYRGINTSCKTVADTLLDQAYTNIDDELFDLCKYYINANLSDTDTRSDTVRIASVTSAANLLAYVCAVKEIYWDDSDLTTDELALGPIGAFKKTIFGHALATFGCYTSMDSVDPSTIDTDFSVSVVRVVKPMTAAGAAASVAASKGTPAVAKSSPVSKDKIDPATGKPRAKWVIGTSSKARKAKVVGDAPKDDYKSSGGQSGNCRDLISKPGENVGVDPNARVWLIQGINPKKAEVDPYNVHIKPLLTMPDASKYAVGSTNKVFFSSGKAYKDCVLYWQTEAEGLEFLKKMADAGRIPESFTDVKVKWRYAKKCGGRPSYRDFYYIGTEFGQAMIPAHKLNEMLGENFDELSEFPDENQQVMESVCEDISYEEMPVQEPDYSIPDDYADVADLDGNIGNIDVFDEAYHKYAD